MSRTPRLLIPDEPTVYHVMSRTALAGLPMGDVEKDHLLGLMRSLSRLYFTEILGFACMGSHFHLLVRMLPHDQFSDQDIMHRHQQFFGDSRQFSEGHIPFYRQRWASLSEFIKELKQSFSRWYNKRCGRRGFFWSERFKSVIVENGETLVNCLAYIDLNPVRAAIVQKPEKYRWSSLGFHVQSGNPDGFLSLDFGLKQFSDVDDAERLRQYREYVYEAGALDRSDRNMAPVPSSGATGQAKVIDRDIIENERQKNYEISRIDRFMYRTRYFSDSGIIGTKEFVSEKYQRFKDVFMSKREKIPKPIAGLDGIYSLKRLQG